MPKTLMQFKLKLIDSLKGDIMKKNKFLLLLLIPLLQTKILFSELSRNDYSITPTTKKVFNVKSTVGTNDGSFDSNSNNGEVKITFPNNKTVTMPNTEGIKETTGEIIPKNTDDYTDDYYVRIGNNYYEVTDEGTVTEITDDSVKTLFTEVDMHNFDSAGGYMQKRTAFKAPAPVDVTFGGVNIPNTAGKTGFITAIPDPRNATETIVRIESENTVNYYQTEGIANPADPMLIAPADLIVVENPRTTLVNFYQNTLRI